MWHNRLIMRGVRTALCVVQLSAFTERLSAQGEAAHPGVTNITILMIEGSAEIMRSGASVWDDAHTGQNLYPGDRIRTGERSRITLRWSDQSIVHVNELSDLQIQPVSPTTKKSGFSLWQGMLYFFHRDKPADLQVNTRTASAAVRGTEFNLDAEENGRTILTLLDGTVELSNNRGQVSLQSGDQGIAEPGQAPRKTAVINTINVIQWALYYPAVLDLDELPLSPDEQQVLQPSMAAYRSGDLLQALADYPA